MSNLFKTTADAVKGSYWVIWLFIAVLVILFSGAYYFFEDSYSSYVGIQQIQQAWGIKIVTFPLGLYLLAVTPQFAQVVLGYVAATQPAHTKWKYYLAVFFFLVIDGSFDVWYRSDQRLLHDPQAAIGSILVTFLVYTLFSEMFIMIGTGMFFELFPSFKSQVGRFMKALRHTPPKTRQYTPPTARKSTNRKRRTNRGRAYATSSANTPTQHTQREVEELKRQLSRM